jgi:hypothetical protein
LYSKNKHSQQKLSLHSHIMEEFAQFSMILQ